MGFGDLGFGEMSLRTRSIVTLDAVHARLDTLCLVVFVLHALALVPLYITL